MDLVRAGRCFLLARSTEEGRHLWIVLTDPDGTPHQVVAVMIRTRHSYTDDTVILSAGDHPFLRHESAVHYSAGELWSVDKVLRGIKSGGCGLERDASAAVLARVRAGLLSSPYTVAHVREYCHRQFPTP